ncbi:alpha/beta fold hydrolase [Pendulispora brunnea]|uniref:Alpha/beta fold hydrolase n=1 Tax=Pendulispora brunnea TaxID=2905690 RepID=A0ABZ2K4P0_9BACT
MRGGLSGMGVIASVLLCTSSLMASAPDELPAARDGREPVVLVHGWAASAADMATMRDAIAAAGYVTYVANLPGSNNIENGKVIARLVAQALSETHAAKVHLVGHSMGGLAMRYYVKRLGGERRVRTYVAFGTPQYGFPFACYLDENQGGQMCPANPFLADLNAGDDTPGNVDYFTFRSTKDTPNITRLDGGACFHEIPDVEHFDEPKSPAFAQAVLAAIGGSCPGSYVDLPIE